jgi:hypothetical protein
MMVQIEDKEYLIKSKIKVLEGRRNRYLNNDPEILESLEDINLQIQALTNLLEML